MLPNNPFIRAFGIAAIAWVLLQGLNLILDALVRLMTSFAFWVRIFFIPHSTEVAIGIGVIFLIFTAVTSSKD